MVDVDVNYLNIIGSVLLPILTGLITKRMASSGLKAFVLVALSVVSALVQQLVLADGRFEMTDFLTSAFVQFLMAVGIHFGLTKPVGLTGANGALQQAVPGGLGDAGNRPTDLSNPNQTGV